MFLVHFNVHIPLQIVILNNFENCRSPSIDLHRKMAGKISYNFAKLGPFSNGIRNPKKHSKYTKFRECEMS
jgi:hypothetical protein